MSLSWPLYLTAACAAPLYLQIFGDGYQDEGRPVVVIMAAAMMVAIAAGPLDTLLLMAGGSAASLFNTATSLVVNIGLGLLLIPRWGITGAAVAWAAAVVIRNGLAFWQVHRAQGLTPFSRGSSIVALASLLCFAAPLLAIRAYTELTVPLLALCIVGGAAGYAIALWSARRPLALRSMRALLRRGSRPAVPAAA
jgi:O-antigen/teichoic acid export membrane protein